MAFTELYVRDDAAGGGDGTTNTNSGGTGALTFAEMLAYGGSTTLAGKRFNIRKGTYSRTTNSDTFTTTAGAPTQASPCEIRGFNAAIGDLDGSNRPAAGQAITVTDFPTITYTTGKINFGALVVRNVYINGATVNDEVVLGGTFYKGCRLRNTHASGSPASAINIDGGSLVDCDLVTDSNSGTAYAAEVSGNFTPGVVFNCRIEAGNGANGVFGWSSNTHAIGCVFVNCVNGFQTNTSGHNWVLGCSFRNCTGSAIYRGGNGYGMFVANTVAWGAGGSSKFYAGETEARALVMQNCAIGNMGASDTNRGDYPVVGEVSLSADPFTNSSDLSLNNTAGGGADCREAAYGGGDIGAVQSATAGGGGLVGYFGTNGGLNG